MKKRFIALLILPISLGLICLKNSGYLTNLNFTKAEAATPSDQDNKSLVNSIDWIKLKAYWKLLNKLDQAVRKNISNPDFTETEKEFNNVSKYLNNLYSSKLLNLKQKEILLQLFNQRYYHYERIYGMVTCYKPSMEAVNLSKTQYDLEEQFRMLEKLYSENKISDTVYKTTKNKIQEDLKIINNVSYNKDKSFNSPESIYLIDLLSK